MKLKRRYALSSAALAGLVGLLATGCGGGGSDAKSNEIVFGIGDPQLQIGTAPYTSVLDTMGYCKKAGLSLKEQPTQGAVASLQALLTGQVNVVNGGSSAFYQVAAKHPEVRVISLGVGNIWHTYVPDSSPITTLKQLKGKTVGAQSLSSASYLFGRAGMSAGGMNPDSDVKWLSVGVGAQAANAMKKHDIDAYASYEGPSGVMQQLLGEKMRPLPSALDQLPGTIGLATTKKFLADHRDEVVKFLKCYNQGQLFGATNPTAALKIHWKAHPDQKPNGLSEKEAIKQSLPIVADRYKSDARTSGGNPPGYMDTATVQRSIDFFLKTGLIKQKVSAGDVVDLSAAKDAGDYGAAAVKKQAEQYGK
ncbi:MAG TPA: ABC transporter substrate-binding protein [Streptosporangiaceae bacterium]